MSDISEEMGGYMGDGSEIEAATTPPTGDSELRKILNNLRWYEPITESSAAADAAVKRKIEEAKAALLKWRDQEVQKQVMAATREDEAEPKRGTSTTIFFNKDTITESEKLDMLRHQLQEASGAVGLDLTYDDALLLASELRTAAARLGQEGANHG